MFSTAVSASQELIPPPPLPPEAETAFRNMCRSEYRTDEKISRIIEDRKSGWVKYFTPHPLNRSLCVQIHEVAGLKVYRDEQGRLVADYALYKTNEKQDPHGGRMEKEVCHICADGTVQHMVRYSSRYKWYVEVDRSFFSVSFAKELAVREKLGSISQLLPLIHGSYVNRRGYRKERYESLFSQNLLSLESLLTDIKIYIKSLCIFLYALSALEQMHALGFIHRDFRPGNISFIDSLGFLGGLGFAAHINGPYFGQRDLGSIRFAPSEAASFFDQRTNMFAVGASLLRMYRKDLWDEFCDIQQKLWYYVRPLREEGRPDWTRYIDEREKLICLPLPAEGEGREYWPQNIRPLQQELRDPRGPQPRTLSQLISELIDPDPEKRPTCRQAIKRLTGIVSEESKLCC